MFGLMKPRSCSKGEKDLHRRLNYCGTCKTMGNLYGQKSRFLLNHDTVFLSELLTVISGKAEELENWGKAYQSYNCFSLPKNKEEMPIELQLSATATVVLTSYKLADHITDSGHSIWLLGQKLFSKSFREASKNLKTWNFPLEEMDSYLLSQSRRESESLKLRELKPYQEILDYLAEPTAKATALFFQHGAKLVNQPAQENLMHKIGQHFGTIAYLVDAYEDYSKDLHKKEFNALKAAFNSGETLSIKEKSNISQIIWQLAEEINELLPKLEIQPHWVKYFSQRLKDNLSLKLTGKLPLLNKVCSTSERITFSLRKQTALSVANNLTANYQNSGHFFILTKLFSPVVYIFTWFVAFLLPTKTSKVKSYKECVSISLHLISLRLIVKSLVSLLSPKNLSLEVALCKKKEGRDKNKYKNKDKKKKDGNCDDCCDCGDCGDCCQCLEGKSCGACRGCAHCFKCGKSGKVDWCPCDGDCGCCGCDVCPCDGDCCCGCDCS